MSDEDIVCKGQVRETGEEKESRFVCACNKFSTRNVIMV